MCRAAVQHERRGDEKCHGGDGQPVRLAATGDGVREREEPNARQNAWDAAAKPIPHGTLTGRLGRCSVAPAACVTDAVWPHGWVEGAEPFATPQPAVPLEHRRG